MVNCTGIGAESSFMIHLLDWHYNPRRPLRVKAGRSPTGRARDRDRIGVTVGALPIGCAGSYPAEDTTGRPRAPLPAGPTGAGRNPGGLVGRVGLRAGV